MAESVLRNRAKAFAKDIVFTCREMRLHRIEYSLTDQLLRCGTSVAANVYEAQRAHGPKDFVFKLEIALKESNECLFWLELLYETDSLSKSRYEQLTKESSEIGKMITSSINTVKTNNPKTIFN